MQIGATPDLRPESLEEMLQHLEANPSVGSILLMVAHDPSRSESADWTDLLRERRCTVFGGEFPGLLTCNGVMEHGALAVGLPQPAQTTRIDELSNPACDPAESLEKAFPDPPGHGLLFVFVDGLAAGIDRLVNALYDHFGLETGYIGGGCGNARFQPIPAVLDPEGLHADSAVVAWLDLPASIGVAHGWEPVSAPLKVTSASRNVIYSLDWKPAADVWGHIVQEHGGEPPTPASFDRLAPAYPFGIGRIGGELVVRDPIQLQGDALVCVGEVPEGAFVRVLTGDHNTLLNAARKARDRSRERAQDFTPTLRLTMDCISRANFLGNAYDQELAILCEGDAIPLAGALSLGEIANCGDESLEFYNKTVTAGLL
ncbi:FIST signal transduction protein [Thioalkalivibrio sp. ALJT]|uniref:FIST signal transduction protein n=1 Tax=Thioalkalivibrio sp. ALJT TaxID=1158146 RepID=UPI0003A9E149|nr:FIST N-terminal domain-containing protein [Thioalkalivibrio sp. ALJT]